MKNTCLSKYCLFAFFTLESITRVTPFIVEYQKGIESHEDVQSKIVNGKEVEPNFKYPFQVGNWLNSETPIEEVPLLSPCAPTPPTSTTILSQNSGFIATRNTKILPHLNGDPRSKTQNPNLKSHATMELWT